MDQSVQDSSIGADWYADCQCPSSAASGNPARIIWLRYSHHLAEVFSPIVGIYLGATCSSGGCMVKNWTQNRWDDLKTVIQICPFLSIPKGTPILTSTKKWLEQSGTLGVLAQPTPLGASYCRRRRRAWIWGWCARHGPCWHPSPPHSLQAFLSLRVNVQQAVFQWKENWNFWAEWEMRTFTVKLHVVI